MNDLPCRCLTDASGRHPCSLLKKRNHSPSSGVHEQTQPFLTSRRKSEPRKYQRTLDELSNRRCVGSQRETIVGRCKKPCGGMPTRKACDVGQNQIHVRMATCGLCNLSPRHIAIELLAPSSCRPALPSSARDRLGFAQFSLPHRRHGDVGPSFPRVLAFAGGSVCLTSSGRHRATPRLLLTFYGPVAGDSCASQHRHNSASSGVSGPSPLDLDLTISKRTEEVLDHGSWKTAARTEVYFQSLKTGPCATAEILN